MKAGPRVPISKKSTYKLLICTVGTCYYVLQFAGLVALKNHPVSDKVTVVLLASGMLLNLSLKDQESLQFLPG
jgi:hypothetical protein